MKHKVLINGTLCFYKDKAPYVQSGKSILGALEYDEDEDKVRCHECGKWFKSVSRHINIAHKGLTARKYKIKHGLRFKTALISEGTRHKMIIGRAKRRKGNLHLFKKGGEKSRAQKMYYRRSKRRPRHGIMNLRRKCPAQLLSRITALSKIVGRTPSQLEMRESGLDTSAIRYTFGSYAKAMEMAGLAPRLHKLLYTKRQLLAMLLNLSKQLGRSPSRSDLRRGLCPSEKTYITRFGSWRIALRKIGLVPNRKGSKLKRI